MLQQLEIFTFYRVTVRANTAVGMGPEAVEVERTDSTGKRFSITALMCMHVYMHVRIILCAL